MYQPLTDLREELIGLCRKHRVKKLEIFGSAASPTAVDPGDLDFLVEFEDVPSACRADAYFGLWDDLCDLFQRRVDLVETLAVRNPYFLESIKEHRTVLYAA